MESHPRPSQVLVGQDAVCKSERANNSHLSKFFQSPAFIVIVALVLRLAVIVLGHTYRITPRRDHFQFGWEMGRIARSIALGQGFSSPTDFSTGPTAWAPPLYPYLLAGIFRVLGVYSSGSAAVILAINSIFSALTCLTLYHIALRFFNFQTRTSRARSLPASATAPARWAAWTWALLPYAIYWPVRVVWETSLSTFLLSLALLLTLRIGQEQITHARAWIELGLIWGVIALCNPTLLSFLPLSMAWLWYEIRSSPRAWESESPLGASPAGSKRANRLWRNLALLLVVFAAVIAPWLIRNYLTFHQFVFIRDNFGMELHLANNEHSQGLWTRSEHPGNDPQQMATFRDMGELPYMRAEQHAAIAFIRQHPLEFTRNSLKRAVYFWVGNPQETLLGTWNLAPARHLAFFLSALAAFVGLGLCLRNRIPGAFLFACLLIIYPIPYYIAHPSPRYRHPIEPEMVLLIVYLLSQLRHRSIRLPGLTQ
jgi:hypothetical protein